MCVISWRRFAPLHADAAIVLLSKNYLLHTVTRLRVLSYYKQVMTIIRPRLLSYQLQHHFLFMYPCSFYFLHRLMQGVDSAALVCY